MQKILALLSALALCGCTEELYKPHEASSQDQAGSVHIARGMIAPWASYVDSLQPNFTITADGAVAMALPTTSYAQQATADVLNFGLQAGLPQSTQTTSNNTNLNNGIATTTSSSSSATSPGAAPGTPLANAAMPTASALPVPTGALKTDAILQYTAATAIYQEIQILNSYLKDAAFRQGFTPYIVRIPVNVEAFARGEPYDVYLDAGFTAECGGHPETGESASVIPLLVTDDLETSQGTNALDIARQLALSVGGTVQDVALQSQLQRMIDKYKAVLGTEANSLFTVTRGGADNVLHIRIGASADIYSQWAMSTQTHNVTVIVLVPDKNFSDATHCRNTYGEPPRISIIANSSFRDARMGVPLKFSGETAQSDWEAVYNYIPSFELSRSQNKTPPTKDSLVTEQQSCPSKMSDATQVKLMCAVNDVVEGDYKSFGIETTNLGVRLGMQEALWMALAKVAEDSNYETTFVDIPNPPTSPIDSGVLSTNQAIVLRATDDAVTTSLAGFDQVAVSQIQASLACPNNVTMSAAVSRTGATGPITLQFGALGLKDICSGGVSPASGSSVVRWSGVTLNIAKSKGDYRWAGGAIIPKRYVFPNVFYAAQPTKDLFALSAATDALVADATGNGNLRLFIDKLDSSTSKDIMITASGASIVSATVQTSSGAFSSGRLKVTPSATVRASGTNSNPTVIDLQLAGLIPGHLVTIIAASEAPATKTATTKQTVSVPIIAAAPTSVKSQ